MMGVALIMLMVGFIKVCSVHTPSSNPKLPPRKHVSGTYLNQGSAKKGNCDVICGLLWVKEKLILE